MYAEESYSKMTLYAEDREEELNELVRFMEWLRSNRISFGSAFIYVYPWLTPKEVQEHIEFEPYIEFGFLEKEELLAMLEQAGVRLPVRFEELPEDPKESWSKLMPRKPLRQKPLHTADAPRCLQHTSAVP